MSRGTVKKYYYLNAELIHHVVRCQVNQAD